MFLWVFGEKSLTLQFYPSDRGILRNSASGPVPKNAAFMAFKSAPRAGQCHPSRPIIFLSVECSLQLRLAVSRQWLAGCEPRTNYQNRLIRNFNKTPSGLDLSALNLKGNFR